MKTACLPFVLAVLLFSFAACGDDTSCSCPAVPEQPLAEIARTHTSTFGGGAISSSKSHATTVPIRTPFTTQHSKKRIRGRNG